MRLGSDKLSAWAAGPQVRARRSVPVHDQPWGGGQTPGTFGGVESKAQKQHIQCCDNLILQLSKATGAKAQLGFRYSGYILSSHDDFHAVDAEHRIEPLRREWRRRFGQ